MAEFGDLERATAILMQQLWPSRLTEDAILALMQRYEKQLGTASPYQVIAAAYWLADQLNATQSRGASIDAIAFRQALRGRSGCPLCA
jgi:hypothetical protein